MIVNSNRSFVIYILLEFLLRTTNFLTSILPSRCTQLDKIDQQHSLLILYLFRLYYKFMRFPTRFAQIPNNDTFPTMKCEEIPEGY